VADIVFVVGNRPTLSAHDAEMLAQFLVLGREAAMSDLAGKIRDHLRNAREITLDRKEQTALAQLFNDAPDLIVAPEFAAYRRLNDEVVAALETQ